MNVTIRTAAAPHGIRHVPIRRILLTLSALAAAMLPAALLPATPARAALELEVDPLAYALDGYSVHAAWAFQRTRVDVGAYGLTLPEDSANENYTVSFVGQGVKWDYFGDRVDGFFAGVEAGTATLTFTYDDPDDALPEEETTRQAQQYGVRIGYRFGTDGFYVSPWLGIGRTDLDRDVKLGGQRYKLAPVTTFPTVHLGYRF